jgi:hypothetical protein
MSTSSPALSQPPEAKKNWLFRRKTILGAVAILIILIILWLAGPDPVKFFFGVTTELYVGLLGIYLIIIAIHKRKTLGKYFNIVWLRLERWEGSNPASPGPKTKKDWYQSHKLTTWATAVLLLVIILLLIPGVREVALFEIIFILYVYLFVFYMIAWVIKWRKRLGKDLAVFFKKSATHQ